MPRRIVIALNQDLPARPLGLSSHAVSNLFGGTGTCIARSYQCDYAFPNCCSGLTCKKHGGYTVPPSSPGQPPIHVSSRWYCE